ncbi:fumarylacetoacetate hydrolase family protein [Tumebacillus permanentifrigoris]|uniref:Fumarylacetoacetate (FAA) hydrolase n=1 Tax=Tumebacillus permanentifrigoris TaxID=378543 RepID=A0A316D6H8_9BACL|nr:fumarylacetoacetate hydrolase family protein [Tumebacillus permanentifrigoris]PWK10340.1 fumarylacetoacetate (FAA) hydrolase [Tumebacillus permanentifrigoris]
MKYVTYLAEHDARAGLLIGAHVVDLERGLEWAQGQGRCLEQRHFPASLLRFLELGLDGRELGAYLEEETGWQGADFAIPLEKATLLAPLPTPRSFRDFYAFEEHVKTARANRGAEMVPEWYDFPVFYFSNHNAIVGPEADVERPSYTQRLDFELEIAIVIGKQGRDIAPEQAHEHIAGLMVLNDWSARDVQMQEVKVGLGPAKGKDFATSMGPYLLTLDELEAVRDGNRWALEMTARVNGRVLSRGNFQQIYFSVGELIARASDGVTLYPGEVLGTGTVGTGCILELTTDVHRWLEPGDLVELEVERLGVLRNRIV